MKKSTRQLLENVFLAFCVLLVVSVIGGLTLGKLITAALSHRDAPSWLQAVGSLLALAVAIGVGWYQTKVSRDMAERAIQQNALLIESQRLDALRERFTACVAVIRWARKDLMDVFKEACFMEGKGEVSQDQIDRLHKRIEYVDQVVAHMDALELPSVPAIAAALEARDVVSDTVGSLRSILRDGDRLYRASSLEEKVQVEEWLDELQLLDSVIVRQAVRVTRPDNDRINE